MAAEEDKNPPLSSKGYEAANQGSGAFLSSRFAHSEGDHSNAIRYLEETLKRDPNNLAIKNQLLVAYITQGDIAKAIAYAQELTKDGKQELVVDLLLAVDATQDSAYANAATTLTRVYANTSGSIWLPLFKAWLTFGEGKLKKPVQVAEMMPEGEKAPPFLAYHLALLNDRAGFTDVAAQQYAQSLADLEKAPFRAVEAAADFYRRTGEKEKLAKLKADYIGAHPGMSALVDSDNSSNLAALMAQEAKPSATQLVGSVQEGVAEILFTMASVLYSVDADQDTQLYLRMALYLRPDFPLAQLLLGNALEADGQYAEAAEVYGEISPESPFYGRGLLRKAYMVEREGKIEEALAMLDTLAAASPKDPEVLVAKGDLLRTRSRFAEAAEAYTQAIARLTDVSERHWGLFFARGACYERLNDWDRAEADLRKALKLSPNQPEALNYLGYGLISRDLNVEEGREFIEQAYALQPTAAHIIDSLGWALYKTGDMEGAVQYLEQAIEQMPGDATVNDHLGDAYWQAGRKTEARYQWQRALSFKPDPAQEQAIQQKLKDGLAPVVAKAPDKNVQAATHASPTSIE